MNFPSKILLVEDDRSIAGALAQALSSTYDIDVAQTGKLAIYKTDTNDFDLIILDLNLPDISGLVVCQQLRERGVKSPVLILSGEDKVLTKIHLLDAGANDYLTKPFSVGELKARMRNLIRSVKPPLPAPKQMSVGDLNLDTRTFSVQRAGQTVMLRPKEFALLECLMQNAGSVVTRQILTRSVWQESDELWTNTVDVHIKHLRDKVDRPFSQPLIKTVHGLGYKLEASPQLINTRD